MRHLKFKWQQLDSNPCQMYSADKYSQHSSIIWPVWLYGWVFIYELSGCGFKSRCCHLKIRYCTLFRQRVPWHSSNHRVLIQFEKRLWFQIPLLSLKKYFSLYNLPAKKKSFGNLFIVERYVKGIFKKNITFPKYYYIWNVSSFFNISKILEYDSNWGYTTRLENLPCQ